MPISLSDVKRALEARGGTPSWMPGETRISKLYRPGEPSGFFGLSIDSEEEKELLRAASRPDRFAAALPKPPPRVDWRTTSGVVTPIKDQGECQSCVAFATCAAMESAWAIMAIDRGETPPAIDLAEAHLFACGCGGDCCGKGWDFTDALTFASRSGVGLEEEFPYAPRDQDCRHVAPQLVVTRYQSMYPADLRNAAVARKPVVAGMRVYEDFLRYQSGVYEHVIGDHIGNHAVLVVGYDDEKQYWIVKNSWGVDFGEKGFFRIKYGSCDLDGAYPFFEIDVSLPTAPEVRRTRRRSQA